MRVAIGVDIGGTFTKLVAVTADGSVRWRARVETEGASAERLLESVRSEIEGAERSVGEAERVGVACPGLVRRDSTAVHWMKGRLEVLEGLEWQAALGRAVTVPVINDAHAALLGELWLGAARGCRDVVMLTLGTGVGGAIVSDGRILAGATGRAGHLGHIALQVPAPRDIVNTPGSLEDAIGNHSVETRSQGRFASTEALLAAHTEGDAFAGEVWLTSVRCLAAGLASIINAVDPARIVLGGGIAARAGRALFDPLDEFMNEYEWRPTGGRVEIVPAVLGDEAGAIGAAWYAMERTA